MNSKTGEINQTRRFLNTPDLWIKLFMLVIILLTMYNNLEHSATVYINIAANPNHSDWYNRFQGYLVVIVFDLAVIAFILKSKNTESKVFAWLLFLINCLFFNIIQSAYQIIFRAYSIHPDLLNQDQEAVKKLISEVNALIAKIAFAGIFSYSIHRFSHLWYDGLKDDVIKPIIVEKERVIQELVEELDRVKILLEKLEGDKRALKADFEEKVQDLDRLQDDFNDVVIEKNGLQARLTRRKNNGALVLAND